MTEPTFEDVDISLDEPPKRRRGRPPGSRNNSTGSNGDKAPRRNSLGWVKKQASTLVGSANLLVTLTPYRSDALSDEEMDLLTDALTAEAMASTRVMRWLERAGIISPHFLLIKAAWTIALPRLQSHGLIPAPEISEEQKERLREYFRSTGQPIPTELETTVSMEARGASNDNGEYR